MQPASDRLPTLLLSLALIAGCGGDAEPAKETPAPTEPAAAKTETPPTEVTPPPKPVEPTPTPTAEKPVEPEKPDVEPAVESAKKPATEDTSAAAVKKLEAFGGMRHLPEAYGYEKLSLESAFQVPMFGPTEIKLTTDWEKGGKPLGIGVELPKQLAEQMPEMVPMIEKQVGMIAQLLLGHLFLSPDAGLEAYDASLKEDRKGKSYVELIPKDEPIGYERRRMYFDDDGLVTEERFMLHVDGDDPNMAQFVGFEFEMSFEYLKQGDRYLISNLTAISPTGDAAAKIDYYELPQGRFLPKSVTVEMAISPQPLTFNLVNYSVDGKVVEATKQKEEPKPEMPKVPTIPEVPKDEGE